jgi:NAD(P)-dependent dehydrogenase (short-subunit alcohol dehydrogenase family)
VFSLADRVALVTGGNGGLGLAMARGLRSAGATVAVTGRDPGKNEAAVREFGIRDEKRVASAVGEIVGRFGSLDVLVNNAGVGRGGTVQKLDVEAWDEVVDSHLRGAFLCSETLADRLLLNRSRARGGAGPRAWRRLRLPVVAQSATEGAADESRRLFDHAKSIGEEMRLDWAPAWTASLLTKWVSCLAMLSSPSASCAQAMSSSKSTWTRRESEAPGGEG